MVTSLGHRAFSIIEPRAGADRAEADSHSILGLLEVCLLDLPEPVTRIIVPVPPLTTGSRHLS